jgi:hypothetical protein
MRGFVKASSRDTCQEPRVKALSRDTCQDTRVKALTRLCLDKALITLWQELAPHACLDNPRGLDKVVRVLSSISSSGVACRSARRSGVTLPNV